MELSKNFTLAEMTRSDTAEREGIDNTPDKKAEEYLERVCNEILQPVREHYGVPITPSSGFRCEALNSAIGGSPKSQHMLGQAVDFTVPGIDIVNLARWIRDNVEFDQLILEQRQLGKAWIHCSISEKNRNEVLTKTHNLYAKGLPHV
ncbi:MAG: peptidase M15 [Flavobacteriales bacterium]|nr:peptidase M15 [Flavobacteriales bacterium]